MFLEDFLKKLRIPSFFEDILKLDVEKSVLNFLMDLRLQGFTLSMNSNGNTSKTSKQLETNPQNKAARSGRKRQIRAHQGDPLLAAPNRGVPKRNKLIFKVISLACFNNRQFRTPSPPTPPKFTNMVFWLVFRGKPKEKNP